MIIVIETAIMLAYMINSILGIGVMLAVLMWKLMFSKKGGSIYQSFELMIMALPLAYIGIAGPTMHQLFSWYHLFLIAFFIKIIVRYSGRIPFSVSAMIPIMIMLFCLLLNLLWAKDIPGALTEIAQMMIMVIPLAVVHSVRDRFLISRDEAYQLLGEYVDVCTATAIVMLMQYVMYYYAHRQIGMILFSGNNRVQFYALFKGASILPIYMGIGVIFLFIECLEKRITIAIIAKMAIIFLASTLNSSRTALLSMMIVMVFICIKYFMYAPSLKGLSIAVIGFTGFYYAIDYITRIRNKLSNFLDANGRIETWRNGIRIWSVNAKNIILGEGFTGGRWEGITKPHNLIIQTMAQCGIIITIAVMVMIGKYLIDNRKNPYVFIPFYLILSGMMVTDFYANAFTTVAFMLVDLYCEPENSRRRISSKSANRTMLRQKEAKSI